MSFEKIGFIGLGLIGGSIAKKLKINNPAVHIIATAGHETTITTAHTLGIIDNDKLLDLESFSDCDYIFLCAPVQRNLTYLEQLKDIISPNCMITDVGSTKSEIHQRVEELGLQSNFIGGHPMTGSEKTGILNATEYLMENAYYVITPTNATKPETLNEFHDFIASLGAIPIILEYKQHDYATAAISHLPHMIAFSLVNLIHSLDDSKETMKTIAAGGFRDITRIASSSPVMWEHICRSNKEELLTLIHLYQKELSSLEKMITEEQSQKMNAYFQAAKDYRDSITVLNSYAATIYELYLDLIDEAGAIANIASILAQNDINIKNIGIINNREFEEGVLRIEFYNSKDLELSSSLLQKENYTIYKR